MNIPAVIARELSLDVRNVQNALELLAEGSTVPFIARYRKERTGNMDETVLRALYDRYEYLTELEKRKQTILASIEEQGKLTEELKARILECLSRTELEDLYLPYRPKRRTRAQVALEKGLEPLAEAIKAANLTDSTLELLEEAAKYISDQVATAQEALAGASDILAEEVSEKAELRAAIRDYFWDEGYFVARVKEGYELGTTKFEMYRDYRGRVKEIPAHNLLALRRGEEEGVLEVDLEFDEAQVLNYLRSKEVLASSVELRQFYTSLVDDAFRRLMKNSLIAEVRMEKKRAADIDSIRTFEKNLKELLLASPAGMKPSLGIDPGFRTGCKVVALGATGNLLEYATIFPHQSARERMQAAATLKSLIRKHSIELIAIGNGTAGRETEQFVGEVIAELDPPPVKVMVSEAGASIYSASEVAREEFPDLDLTVRGAVSIARRLQDPLAELVKIDPKSIGVGQYQHDVDQNLLKKRLEETVESCVNYVGVDLNTASKELLRYVAGIKPSVAASIVEYRTQHGPFQNRQQLKQVPKFGSKTFEQASGFLRIRGGSNPLDNSAVHPESYYIVEQMARDLDVPLDQITRVPERVKQLDLSRYVSETVGEPTLRDILAELQKPGRDPREEFQYARSSDEVRELKDLRPGMWLEGVVTNVTNFGAFVDIGVHQDGLVHISQISDHRVEAVKDVLKVGQEVEARIVRIDPVERRIGLSIKAAALPDEEFVLSEEMLEGLRPGEDLGDLAGAFDAAFGLAGKTEEEWRPGESRRKGREKKEEERPE
ncbi:MAG: Tex family protein [Candidatus Bathyarchaeia archaeon]